MSGNEQQLLELKQQIERFSDFNKERLIRRPDLGNISFEELLPDFNRINDVIDYLKILPLEILTIEALDAIKNELNDVNNLFDQISHFKVKPGSPGSQKDNFIEQIRNKADALFTTASLWIPFLAYQKGDADKNIELLSSLVKKAEELIENNKKILEQSEKDQNNNRKR